MSDALKRLDEIAKLPANWDGYGADAPWPDAIAVARRLIEALQHPPAVVPCSDGGVQLEWHRSGFEIEVAVQSHGQITDDDIYLLDVSDAASNYDEGVTPTDRGPNA